MAAYANITGRRSGRLTAKKFHRIGAAGAQLWVCECVCGRIRVVSNTRLLSGNIRACIRCEKQHGRFSRLFLVSTRK
jgi:hypothetical protein